MARNDAYKLARDVYDMFVDGPDEFTTAEVKMAMREALEVHREDAFDALVESAYTKAEDAQKKRADTRQGNLFDIGGVLILGNDRRQGLKWAMKRHYIEALAVKKANVDAVTAKYKADAEWLETLDPYWNGVATYAQAIEAYLADNPDAKSA